MNGTGKNWPGGRMGARLVDRLRTDTLFRHSILLMTATQVGNGCNFLFQFVMMRFLPLVEYGVLSALLGLMLIVAVPLESIRSAVAYGVADTRAQAIGLPRISSWVFRWVAGTAGAGLLVIVVFSVWAGPLSAVFYASAPEGLILTGFLLAGAIVWPVLAGALQGMEWFGRMAIVTQMEPLLRLVLGVLFVWGFAFTAQAALWARVVGLGLSLSVGLFVLLCGLGWPNRVPDSPPHQIRYLFCSWPALIGFAFLMNADIVLVKILFSPSESGLFARAATLARAVAFLPMPVALVVFPKLVAKRSSNSRRLARRALMLTLVIAVVGTAAGVALAGPFWSLFTGAPASLRALQLTRALMLGMAPIGVVFTQLHILLARRRFFSSATLLVLAFGYAGLVFLRAHAIEEVPPLLALVNLLSVLVLAVPCFSWKTFFSRGARRSTGRGGNTANPQGPMES